METPNLVQIIFNASFRYKMVNNDPEKFFQKYQEIKDFPWKETLSITRPTNKTSYSKPCEVCHPSESVNLPQLASLLQNRYSHINLHIANPLQRGYLSILYFGHLPTFHVMLLYIFQTSNIGHTRKLFVIVCTNRKPCPSNFSVCLLKTLCEM